MNFSLEVLSVHENIQEALCGVKAKDFLHVSLRVVNEFDVLAYLSVVNLVVSVDYLGDGHANVPDHFWGGLFLIV